MQQSVEREISAAFQRLPITLDTPTHRNLIKEMATPFKTKIFTAIKILCEKTNLSFNKKTDQVFDSFHKRIEKDGEIPLGLSYLTESNHSNIGEEKSHYGLS